MVMLYSAGMLTQGTHYLKLQLLWCAIGFIACVCFALVDYKYLKAAAPFLFVLALVLLTMVLTVGKRNGARRWFAIGAMTFQPSEAAKIALIIILAAYGEHFQRLMATFKHGLLFPALIIAAIIGLIFVEP